MKFTVAGADRDTGEDIEIVVEADTEASANAKAQKRGMLVSSCTPNSVARKPVPIKKSPAPPPKKGRVARLLTSAGIIIGVVVVFLGLLYQFKLKPEHEKIQETIRSAAAQAEKTYEATVRNNAKWAKEAEDRVNEAKAKAAEIELGLAQKRKSLQEYIEQCEPFVRESKAMQARIETGISFEVFTDKLGTMVDHYANIGPTPDDEEAARFAEAAQKLIKQYRGIGEYWSAMIVSGQFKSSIRGLVGGRLTKSGEDASALVYQFGRLKYKASQ